MKAVRGKTRALPHLVAALLLGAWVSAAAAHALLNKSDPARRAVLSKPPTRVRLWFNERLEAAFSTLSVLDTNAKPVTQDPAHVSTEDPKLIELQLPPLDAGTYTVKYKVLSIDGHTVKASYTFTIKGR